MKKYYFFVVFLLILFFGCSVSVFAADNSALIAQLQAQLAQLQAQLQALLAQQTGTAWCHTFYANLGFVNSGTSEIGYLHIALGKEGISYSPDSVNVYSTGTERAVKQFQAKYAIRQTGYVGPLTRAKLNSLYGCAQQQTTGVNGVCGSSNGKIYENAPTAELCSTGTASAVSSSSQGWTWSCLGYSGGSFVYCQATKPAQTSNPACGGANGQSSLTAPSSGLCLVGEATAVVSTSTTWTWDCYISIGSSVPCSANKSTTLNTTVNGSCGTAAKAYDTDDYYFPYSDTYCSTGTPNPYYPNFPSTGASITWTCQGSNGGTTANCTASKAAPGAVNGSCGTAAKAYDTDDYYFPYSDTYCATGTSNPSSPSFPSTGSSTTWTCAGSNGGTTATCTASKAAPGAVNGSCGTAAKAYTSDIYYFPYSDTYCATGTSNPSSPSFPSTGSSITWTCQGSNGGTTANCTASKAAPGAVNGSCGTAAKTYEATDSDFLYSDTFCSTGVASTSYPGFPAAGASVTWTCQGSNGGTNATCTATRRSPAINGACGSANATNAFSIPTTNLCLAGTASAVSGSGPWSWTCTGSNGGTTASCATNNITIPVNGTCGLANGVASTSTPSTSLCSYGSASMVSFTSRWEWTCNGISGGSAANCSAPRNNICGPAAKTYTYNETFPSGDYCAFGIVSRPSNPAIGSSVTWTCTGSTGASSATCTASRSSDPSSVAGLCGSANGTYASVIPSSSSQLCFAGTASSVLPESDHPAWAPPWHWTCQGSQGSAPASCATSNPLARDDFSNISYLGMVFSKSPIISSAGVTISSGEAIQFISGGDFSSFCDSGAYTISPHVVSCPTGSSYRICVTSGRSDEWSNCVLNLGVIAKELTSYTPMCNREMNSDGYSCKETVIKPYVIRPFPEVPCYIGTATDITTGGVETISGATNALYYYKCKNPNGNESISCGAKRYQTRAGGYCGY